MIVKSGDAKKRESKGIALDVLAVGRQSMLIRVYCKAGDCIPAHSHPNEQTGYIVSGKVRLTIEGHAETLEAGDSYSIPADAPHSLDALADSAVLDFFVPPRADYL
jgi:quercetin dioxygenase-like cupin family protein